MARQCLASLPMSSDRLGILLISGDAVRTHYAFVVAAGAAAIGRAVTLFATGEGCRALLAVPGRLSPTPGVAGLLELRDAARELGVRMIACEAGLRMSGIDGPLAEAVEVAGIVTFLEATQGGQVITL